MTANIDSDTRQKMRRRKNRSKSDEEEKRKKKLRTAMRRCVMSMNRTINKYLHKKGV